METVAGTGTAGYLDGAGNLAQFATPSGIGMDAMGNLYVADTANHRVRKIVLVEPKVPHPADNNPQDWRITIGEVTGYSAAWKRGNAWAVPPNRIPIGYMTRAAALWKGGEGYTMDSSVPTAPLWWVNAVVKPVGETGSPRRVELHNARTFQGLQLAADSLAVSTMPANYLPGQPLTVTIAVTPTADVTAYAVEDQPPEGWVVSAISDGGVFDSTSGKVKWGPFFDNKVRSLSYEVIPPASATNIVVFQGVASFDGVDVPLRSEVDPNVARPQLTVRWKPEVGQMEIDWTVGTLESASVVTGPWKAVADAEKPPYRVPLVAPAEFYRVRVP